MARFCEMLCEKFENVCYNEILSETSLNSQFQTFKERYPVTVRVGWSFLLSLEEHWWTWKTEIL